MIGFLKAIYLLLIRSEYNRLIQALDRPAQSQEKTLESILSELNQSSYGKKYGVITNKEDYKKKIPIVEYDDIRSFIDEQINTSIPCLNSNLPKIYEFTSGSSGSPKPIPYTEKLLKSFQKLFKIWSYDLLSHAPIKLESHHFYISVSPLIGEHQGLKDDRDYLGGLTKLILKKFWRGHELGGLKNADDYQEALAMSLLIDSRLEILSIWSPRLLTASLEYMEGHWTTLRLHLSRGTYSKPGLNLSFTPRVMPEKFHQAELFPSLKLVSSWGSAHGEADYERLKKRFPKIWFQKKGLLATEAPISLPLVGETGFAPMLTEIYFEFRDLDQKIFDLHEVKIDQVYELIFSTKGGLYRYSVGDLVQIKESKTQTPFFEFVGRSGLVSDLCGEKLSEKELHYLLKNHIEGSSDNFIFFPDKDHYLVIGSKANQKEQLETILQKSPHYHYARKAGQLKELEYIQVNQLPEKIIAYFVKIKNMKAGDLKPQILYPKLSDRELADYLSS